MGTFILIFCFNLWAKTTPKVEIQQLDPAFPVERMISPGVQIHKVGSPPVQPSEKILNKEFQKKALSETQLSESVSQWDGLQRDLLFINSKNLSLKDLEKKYPKMDAAKLKTLKGLVQAASVK